MKDVNPFYKTKQWERTRAAVLRRDKYQCQLSRRYGKLVPADTVHHIFPLDEYPEYRLCKWNLISLSAEKHNELHDRNTNALTKKGEDLLVRTARKYGIDANKPSPT